MSDLTLAFGNGENAGAWYLTSTKPWFTPIDISLLPGPQPVINTSIDLVTVTVAGAEWSDDFLYFGRVLANSLPDGTDTIDVVRFWNDVKNVQAISGDAEKLYFDGFVHVDVMVGGLSTLGSEVILNGSKRGNVISGAGDDIIKIAVVSNTSGDSFQNDFRIASGDGDDLIVIGGLDIAQEIADGDMTFVRSSDNPAPLIVSGAGRNTYIDAGDGNDHVIGYGSNDHIIGGADEGEVELVTVQSPPSGFGYAVGGGNGDPGSGKSTLYKIDLDTGLTNVVGTVSIPGKTGPLGGLDVESLTMSPTDGFLYGVCKAGGNTVGIVKIDPNTAAATFVGSNLWANLQDMAFDPEGNLYLVSNSDFIRVNPSSGVATVIGNNTLSSKIGALAIDPDSGAIYGLAREGSNVVISIINEANGQVLSTFKITGIAQGAHIEGMSFDSDGNLWALDRVSGTIYEIDLAAKKAVAVSKTLGASNQKSEGFEAIAIETNADDILSDINAVGGDLLEAAEGADHFLYRPGDGVDTINGFELGVDTLHILGFTQDQIEIVEMNGDTFVRFHDDSPDGYVDGALIQLTGITGYGIGSVVFSDSGLF